MRLIEKFSESIKVLNDYRNRYHAESSGTEKCEVANAINDILPKFCELIENDAEPVVHGHWATERAISVFPICSNCNTVNACHSPYCGGCGAKMDEGKVCQTEKK